ncbi:MAG: hypothetical protein K9J06_13635 [Flavobacteriales bacterium]|nr:hypothetical protein [Flavobacteriales bacterium]
MSNKHNPIGLLSIALVGALSLSGCSWDGIEVPEPPEVVSFSENIVPIFNSSCNMTGCHPAGGIAPDLTSANAYTALMGMPGMINTTDPAESKLYKKMAGTATGQVMPPAGMLEQYKLDLVLAWIEDGAQDN